MVTATRAVPVQILISGKNPGLPAENSLIVSGQSGSIRFNFLSSELQVFSTGSLEPTLSQLDGGNAWSEVGTPALAMRIRSHLLDGEDICDLATLSDGAKVQRV